MSEMGLAGLKSRFGVGRAVFHLEGSRAEFISVTFPASRGCQPPIPWLVVFFHVQSQQGMVESFSHHIAWTLTLLPPSSTSKDSCDYLGPTRIIQVHLPTSRLTDQQPYFHLQPESSWFCKVPIHMFRGLECAHFGRLLSC